MQYEIMSRYNARQATYEKDASDTAIISITDPGTKSNKFYPQPWLLAVLELQFVDVEEPRAGHISHQQAKEIADFIREFYIKVNRIIVHCEYGQSRSAGVAAAISKFYEDHDSGIFSNVAYSPNKTCYFYVLDALKKLKINDH